MAHYCKAHAHLKPLLDATGPGEAKDVQNLNVTSSWEGGGEYEQMARLFTSTDQYPAASIR